MLPKLIQEKKQNDFIDIKEFNKLLKIFPQKIPEHIHNSKAMTENTKRVTTPFNETSVILISKPDNDSKRKSLANFTHDFTFKNFKQNSLC